MRNNKNKHSGRVLCSACNAFNNYKWLIWTVTITLACDYMYQQYMNCQQNQQNDICAQLRLRSA